MKKTEKYIYLVLGIILIVVIACGITYIIATNNNQTENTQQENNGQNNNQEENNNQNNEEQITLSEEELEEYLSYVPRDIMNDEQNMYINPQSSDKLPIETLLGATINYADNYTSLRQKTELGDEFLFSKLEINKLMMKLYNREIIPLEGEFTFGCAFYSEYDSDYYKQSGGCGNNFEHISSIKEYYATEKELIIYEYGAMVEINEESMESEISCYNLKSFINYQTKAKFELPHTVNSNHFCNYTFENQGLTIEEYFETIRENYTLYKHTFKKNDTGYYWYSTEIENE